MTVVYVAAAAISLGSMLVRRPWVGYLARRTAPREVQTTPAYREMTYALTSLWTLLFGVGAVVASRAPGWLSLAVGVAFLVLGRISPTLGERYVQLRWSAADEAALSQDR